MTPGRNCLPDDFLGKLQAEYLQYVAEIRAYSGQEDIPGGGRLLGKQAMAPRSFQYFETL